MSLSPRSAGFVVSDLRPDASSNRGYDLATTSTVHQYSRPQPRLHEKRSRSDYSPTEGPQTSDDSAYLKSSTDDNNEQNGQTGAGFVSARTQVRRKPTYSDKPYEVASNGYFDPAMSKHFLKTHFRDTDYSGSSLVETGEQVSASNDHELAQLAATMSELQSSPTSTPEMFSPADLSSALDPHAYSALGSLSAANSPLPAASAVPGECPSAEPQDHFSEPPARRCPRRCHRRSTRLATTTG